MIQFNRLQKIVALVTTVTITCVPSIAVAATVVNLSRSPAGDPVNSFDAANTSKSVSSVRELNVDMQKEEEVTLPNGKKITRYQQLYKGIPVWGHAITTVQDHNQQSALPQEAQQVSGTVVNNLNKDISQTKAKITPTDALNIAKKTLDSKFSTSNDNVKKIIWVPKNNGVARLAYFVSFFAQHENSQKVPYFLIDANNGKIIDEWDNLTTLKATGFGGNPNTGKYMYGKEYDYLDVAADCSMKNADTELYDLRSTRNIGGFPVFKFTCPHNTVDPMTNGAFGVADDAYFFSGKVIRMYQDWFNLSPVRLPIQINVHFGESYDNAFWNGSSITFGDGYDFFPLVTPDIVGHEISHGFTNSHSNLIYRGESGGMNEAFSDMAGVALQTYLYQETRPIAWLMGGLTSKNKKPLRDLRHQAIDGYSIENASQMKGSMNPHASSGVYNRAFYLLATSPNWDVKRAFTVFVYANMLHWTPNSTFNSGACGVIYAAEDLGYDTQAIIESFDNVGVHCREEKH